MTRQLEAMGLGIALLKTLGGQTSSSQQIDWISGIAGLAASQQNRVQDLIAEWADVDAIATSIAHGITYFCTNDTGQGALGKGITSALSVKNAAAITSRFGIEFITPDGLVQTHNL